MARVLEICCYRFRILSVARLNSINDLRILNRKFREKMCYPSVRIYAASIDDRQIYYYYYYYHHHDLWYENTVIG